MAMPNLSMIKKEENDECKTLIELLMHSAGGESLFTSWEPGRWN